MTPPPVKTHSKLGLAAFLGGLAVFAVYAAALLSYYLEFGAGYAAGPLAANPDLGLVRLVILMIVPVPAHLVLLVVSAAALFFPRRRKLFPALGAAANLVFGLCGLFPWLYLVTASLGRVS
ncbi:MAG: hypothetical protein JSS81_12870 [Acidobacteria bacterium]|nr:hypothetical protein [Acidobacteriota bacterium]